MAWLLLTLVPSVAAAGVEADMWAKAQRDAVAFKARTGVDMVWLEGDSTKGQALSDEITAYPPIALDLDASLTPLIAELSVYPDGFLRAAGLKQVVLARGLERHGKPWGGFAIASKGLLLISLASVTHAAVTIHHEVFHLAQRTPTVSAKLDAWLACNPKGFRYEEDGQVDYSVARVATITPYARTSFREDQAELFAWMVVDSGFVEIQAASDEGLACKAKRMRELAKALDGEFDERRWTRLKGRRPGEPL